MSSNSKVHLDEVQWLVWLFLGWTFWLAIGHAPQPPKVERPVLCCAECGGPMRLVAITFAPSQLLSEHALDYLDSSPREGRNANTERAPTPVADHGKKRYPRGPSKINRAS